MKANYTMKNYSKKNTFSSFLPGIAGEKGIPLWCFYVNRNQGVVSFGYENKDHAIMEFYPAHQAYYNVSRTGFRTFIKVDGEVFEAFRTDSDSDMTIYQNKLELVERNEDKGLEIKVKYFTLPNEKIGALVRRVEIKNVSDEEKTLEVIDGMPNLVPSGINMAVMKEMGQTAKAWMSVNEVNKIPFFKVRASMEDSASVSEQKEGNFAFAMDGDDNMLASIVDPFTVFAYDNSLETPVNFIENPLSDLLKMHQNNENELPSAFFAQKKHLKANESMFFNEVIGHVNEEKELVDYSNQKLDSIYFLLKEEEADKIVEDLTKTIETKSGNDIFDRYAKYTYMDNVLRGGSPTLLGDDKTFYVYSRKHGDLERDYNYFSMSAENYSQGNGNFRDVNQNRRCDNFYNPVITDENIKLFYNLVQIDGYNPLVITRQTFTLNEDIGLATNIQNFLKNEFTPGSLSAFLDKVNGIDKEEVFNKIFSHAKANTSYDFNEGYWSDHFTYNLDLIEEYLNIYPEKESEILLDDSYRFASIHAKVNPRSKRYVSTEKGIRQYNCIEEVENEDKWHLSAGNELKSTLIQKLILLSAVKFSTLDPYGFGIEMEGGKPGWYDALNGLPGIFGSSMNETYEVLRNITYTIKALDKVGEKLTLIKPLTDLIFRLDDIVDNHSEAINNELSLFDFWNDISKAREDYRDAVYGGEVTVVEVNVTDIKAVLSKMEAAMTERIDIAVSYNDNFVPSYFYYEVSEFKAGTEITPVAFNIRKMADFLEGSVHYLKLSKDEDRNKDVYDKVKKSSLYDKKLDMYKVNGPLERMTYEIGRCKSFSPGWLENESIWLHMEYKYLLQMLKSGLHKEFFRDFRSMAICFQDPDVYGRSVLENSSFIASSANPNESTHGRGFVARLSGSTAEFLSIYKEILFGSELFRNTEKGLGFELSPSIPDYLISDELSVSGTMLSDVTVEYRFSKKADVIPGSYKISKYELHTVNKEVKIFENESIDDTYANMIRNREVNRIICTVEID